jgi:hypothetical protein
VILSRPIALAFVVVAAAGCASVNARLIEGRRLSAEGDWRRAFEVFGEVRSRTCSDGTTDERCQEAIIGQAEAKLHLGEPQESYWLLVRSQSALSSGRPVDARTEAVQKEAQRALGSRLARRPGRATLRVSFESNTTGSFTPQAAALTLDLIPIPLVGLNDAKRGPVRGSTAITTISAGEHEIETVTKYASGGRLPPDYFIWVRDTKKIEVADGDALEIEVRFSEKPTWSSSAEAIEATTQVRHGPPAK